ncbi:MAG: hypothetical protein HY529_01130 [Chloroflexi bacterium]|nr:hypothetical protein [Chloroflexota bacterium]
MITTVTTVTTVTVIAALGISALVSIAAVVTLIGFLATRELAATGRSHSSLRIARFASVGIVPLFIAFAVIVAIQIGGLL